APVSDAGRVQALQLSFPPRRRLASVLPPSGHGPRHILPFGLPDRTETGQDLSRAEALRLIPFGGVLSQPSGKRLDARAGTRAEGGGAAAALSADLGVAAGGLTI